MDTRHWFLVLLVTRSTCSMSPHLAVRANANLNIQLGILIFVSLDSEELIEEVVQAAMDCFCVHQEACVSTLNGFAYLPNHLLLSL